MPILDYSRFITQPMKGLRQLARASLSAWISKRQKKSATSDNALETVRFQMLKFPEHAHAKGHVKRLIL